MEYSATLIRHKSYFIILTEYICSIPRQADIPKVLFSACAR
jgi:hypothetical protein